MRRAEQEMLIARVRFSFLQHLRFTARRAATLMLPLLVLWAWSSAHSGVCSVDAAQFPPFTAATGRDYLRAVVEAVEATTIGDADTSFVLARVRSQLGERDAAERWARRALQLDVKRTEIGIFLADLLILQDRLDETVRVLHEALRLRPDVPGGYRRLGMTLDRLGDRAGARHAFEKACQIATNDATAGFLLGQLLVEEGQLHDAETELLRACRLDGQLGGAVYLLSQAQSRLGKLDAARESMNTFEQLKQREKADLDAKNTAYDDGTFMRVLAAGFHTEAAALYLRQNQAALAEAHLRQAVLLNPRESQGFAMLATMLLQDGRLVEARAICETLVDLQPSEGTYRVNLGTLLLQLKDEIAGVQQLKRALELDPKQPQALNNLARFYLRARREQDEAVRLSRLLVELRPTGANYDLLGWALYDNGQIEKAREAAAEAVKRDPTNAVYRERYQKLQKAP